MAGKSKGYKPLPKSGKCSVCGKSISTKTMKSHAAKHKGKRVTYRRSY